MRGLSLAANRHPTPVVLGSGCNAYGLVRSLVQGDSRPVVADNQRGPVFLSRLPAERWLIPDPTHGHRAVQALAARLARLRAGAFVIPTNEPWVHLLNRHRDELGENIHLPLARPEVVELVLRKSAMHRWCDQHQVAEPLTRVFHPGQDWSGFLAWAQENLPVIIKPDTKGIGAEDLGFPTADFHSVRELLGWGRGLGPSGPAGVVLAQRFFSGPGVKLVAWHGYRSPDGRVFMAGITKLRSRPPRLGGCTMAAEFTADPASRLLALGLLERLNYSGFFDLEFLVRPGGQPPLFIELNPRPGMPNLAATAMGLNLPLLGLADLQGRAPQASRVVSNIPGAWVDLSVDPLLALTGNTGGGQPWTLGQWFRSLRPGPVVDAYFNARDPLVFVAACARLAVLGLEQVLAKRRGARSTESQGAAASWPGRWDRIKSRARFFHVQARNVGYLRMTAATLLTVFRRELVFLKQDLDKPVPEAPPIPGLSGRRLQPGEENLLININPALDPREVTERMSQPGQVCWIFFVGNQPIHYRWEGLKSPYLDYLGASLVLAEGEKMHQATFTHRDFRRQGISSRARDILLARSRKLGCPRMIVAIAWWNRPSLGNLAKRSFMQPVGSAIRWRLGPFTKLITTGQVALNPDGDLYLDLP